MDIHAKAYKEEAYEILLELESLLLELNDSPADAELIDRVFGAIHTIKGSGAMFGFDAIAAFTHEIENVLDMVREGQVAVTPELVSLTLAARDKIIEMLDQESTGLDEEAQSIVSGFTKIAGKEEEDEPEHIAELDERLPHPCTYRISFTPAADIFLTGTNPLLLLEELREMGDCTVIAGLEKIPFLEDYDPESCYVSWEILLTTDRDENAIRDVFIFVEDNCELRIDIIFEHDGTERGEHEKRLGEILLDRGDIDPEVLNRILGSQPKIGDRLVAEQVIDRTEVEAALTEQEHIRKVIRQEQEKKISLSSIRVDSKRLDNLVDLVGELVTVQARLSQRASGDQDTELQVIAESVERLTEELRDNTMSIRMLPIGTLFSRFRRLIHDLSGELGKKVRMTTEGSATELDKTVIDQLNEPLVHIIRNAVDHGLESPAQRKEAGKAETGSVHLAAHHTGASVVIEISDDGAGLDPARLKARAVEKGLVSTESELSDEECFNLIFKSGFSTAGEVTGVSGRGVGMDVVKRSIDNLRGTISISSKLGKGTVISLRLPLTLAIIDGLLVRIGEDYFVIPLSVIDECVELTREEAQASRERSMMTYRGEAFTYISLRDMLEIEGEPPDIEKVILVRVRGRKTGFSVDQVIGQHQTVIKTLSRVYGHVEGISGATILGDGTVALILDVNQLVTARHHGGRKQERRAVNEAEAI